MALTNLGSLWKMRLASINSLQIWPLSSPTSFLYIFWLLPESVPIIKPHKDHVRSKLCFTRTEDVLFGAEVAVHLLQRLKTFRQVFVVDFRIKDGHAFLAKCLRAEDVKTRALLDKIHGRQVAQLLLRYVLHAATFSATYQRQRQNNCH